MYSKETKAESKNTPKISETKNSETSKEVKTNVLMRELLTKLRTLSKYMLGSGLLMILSSVLYFLSTNYEYTFLETVNNDPYLQYLLNVVSVILVQVSSFLELESVLQTLKKISTKISNKPTELIQ